MEVSRETALVIGQLKQFLNDEESNTCSLRGEILNIYVRKGRHYLSLGSDEIRTLDIASVSCAERGRGIFTAFLDEVERMSPYPIFVELIHNRRLRSYLLRRSYTIIINNRYFGPGMNSGSPDYHAIKWQ
jgi:hypothetical protein